MKAKFKLSQLFFLVIFNIIIFNLQSSHAQMYWNQAGSFAGNSSSYISVPHSSTLNLTGSFTVEAWINPSTLAGTSKGIVAKGGLLGTTMNLGIRLTSAGRLQFITNGSVRLVSKAFIPTNKFTHFAAIYDSALSTYKFLINGASDTSAVIAASDPNPNTDSLFIGISGTTTPFNGKIDELRIWDVNVSDFQIAALVNSIFGTGGVNFEGLVLSMTFQNSTDNGTLFSAQDFSDKGNNGNSRNVTGLNVSDRPLNNLLMNDCLEFATPGYLIALDNASISPVSKLTFECWIYPKVSSYGIIYKGAFLNGFDANYAVGVSSAKLIAHINNVQIVSNDSVKLFRWSHVAFTYFGTTGKYEFYVNGKLGTTGNITPANISDTQDSLLLGAGVGPFIGSLDEVRIFHDIKTVNEINNSMFESINESNDDDAVTNAVYNFDGLTHSNTDGGPMFLLTGGAGFTFNGVLTNRNQSPVNNFTSHEFQKSYYLRYANKRIPETGTSGVIRDTIDIPLNESITDLNLYVAIDHDKVSTLRLSLTSPIGSSVEFYSNNSLAGPAGDIVTTFDSDADSSLINNRYLSFSPRIKPLFDFDAIFSGQNSKGKWILTINDDVTSDTGLFVAWGLHFNNKGSVPVMLECTSLIQAFYNPSSNTTVTDTVRYFLRSSIFPFSLIDSSRAVISNSGLAQPEFTKAQIQTEYFLQIKHRNSIETWSSSLIKFAQFTKNSSYDFTTVVTKAFGDNMIQVDNSPVKFAVYGGDSNQDGSVDAADIVAVFNDVNNLTSGYVKTDMTGDDFVDAADLILTFNNSNNIVSVITP